MNIWFPFGTFYDSPNSPSPEKIGTFIKTNNEWLLSDFFNSSEEIASGKMSPRPVIKVIWGERHISELSSSHHQTTMYTAPAPLFSTNFPSKKRELKMAPKILMGHHYPTLTSSSKWSILNFYVCQGLSSISGFSSDAETISFFKFLVYHVLYISKNGYTIVNNV